MNEAAWKRLLSQIHDAYVVPVIGPELLVGSGGGLQRRIAVQLLADRGLDVDPAELPPFRELNAAISLLKLSESDLQEVYGDVNSLLQALTSAGDAAIPAPIRQLAEITGFRLFVTLTPDDLLARSLRKRCAVNEIIHAPKLASSEFRDLDDWRSRPGEVQVLYMLGKACSTPLFALHDEDVLEYLHNLIIRGSQVPIRFLGELLDRNLLLIGCNFPDWLSRFFLRLTNKERLSVKAKREWVVEEFGPDASLAGFLQDHSRGTQILSQLRPVEFVAELHRRWMADQATKRAEPQAAMAAAAHPPRALFFISYSRLTDLPRAEALFQALLGIGVGEDEIWFDRLAIEPGQDFGKRILDGIRSCRYFLPLLSVAADRRPEAFVFSEWCEANERKRRMNREFVLPLVVDAAYAPESYTADPVRAWMGIDFGHAPEGVPDERLLDKLTALLREARRSPEAGRSE